MIGDLTRTGGRCVSAETTVVGLNRRRFIQGTGAAALSAGLVPNVLLYGDHNEAIEEALAYPCGQKTHLFRVINALAVNTPAARPF